MKEPPYTPPSKEEALTHWRAQEVSCQKTPGRKDPGLSIVPDAKAVRTILESELSGNPVQPYRVRNPTDDHTSDALKRSQRMTRRAINSKVAQDPDQFLSEVENPEDWTLWFIAHGNMKDAQKAFLLAEYSKLIYKQQADALKEHHVKAREAQRDTENQLAAMKLLKEFASDAAKERDGE